MKRVLLAALFSLTPLLAQQQKAPVYNQWNQHPSVFKGDVSMENGDLGNAYAYYYVAAESGDPDGAFKCAMVLLEKAKAIRESGAAINFADAIKKAKIYNHYFFQAARAGHIRAIYRMCREMPDDRKWSPEMIANSEWVAERRGMLYNLRGYYDIERGERVQ